ncbi:ERF022 protein [Hibiscus syriacus]|uniref:ERF022 protein n=1 Tax=Hibiscus syriacus TaxID=106335 RepID=A0A6A3ABM6_HIBSY|nr:ERF022 protein [Hibiscus syriacus]
MRQELIHQVTEVCTNGNGENGCPKSGSLGRGPEYGSGVTRHPKWQRRPMIPRHYTSEDELLGLTYRSWSILDSLPRPASSSAEDVQMAAQEAALRLGRRPKLSSEVGTELAGGGKSLGPIRTGLSPSQIQAINEFPLDSPKIWMELAGAVLLADPMMCGVDDALFFVTTKKFWLNPYGIKYSFTKYSKIHP